MLLVVTYLKEVQRIKGLHIRYCRSGIYLSCSRVLESLSLIPTPKKHKESLPPIPSTPVSIAYCRIRAQYQTK